MYFKFNVLLVTGMFTVVGAGLECNDVVWIYNKREIGSNGDLTMTVILRGRGM